jgi:hypothetical protein
MRLTDHLHKIEIIFWTACIGLMKNPPIVRLVLLASVILLVAGSLGISSIMIGHQPDESNLSELSYVHPGETETAPVEATSYSSDEKQSNLLIILVDSLAEKKPELKGVWLAGQVVSVPQIIFLPLYPSSRTVEADLSVDFFDLDADGRPTKIFFEFLSSKNVWWNHYVVIDEDSLADMLALINALDRNGEPLNRERVGDLLSKSAQSPDAIIKTQASIASELCRYAPEVIGKADPKVLLGLLTHRMRSDFELVSVQSAHEVFTRSFDSPTCEFPTLYEMTYQTGME